MKQGDYNPSEDLQSPLEAELLFPTHMSVLGGNARVEKRGSGSKNTKKQAKSPRKNASNGGGANKGSKAAQQLLLLSLCGVVAIGLIGYVARNEILRLSVQGWLASKGIKADVKIEQLSLSHISGSVVVGAQKASPNDFKIDHFAVDYSFNPFVTNGLSKLHFKNIWISGAQLKIDYLKGRLDFGPLDGLVSDILSSPSVPSQAPDRIEIQDSKLYLNTDYGLLRAHGGFLLKHGVIETLNFRIPALHFRGAHGEGNLAQAHVKAIKIADTGQGNRLDVEAQIHINDLDIKGYGASSSVIEANDHIQQNIHLQGVRLDLATALPLSDFVKTSKGVSRQSGLDSALGASIHTTLGVRAAQLQSHFAEIEGLESHLALDGQVWLKDKNARFEGHSRLLSRIGSMRALSIDSRDISLEGRSLKTFAALDQMAIARLNIGGVVEGRIGILRREDLFIKDAGLHLEQTQLDIDDNALKLSFVGDGDIARLSQGEASLDETRLQLSGTAQSDFSPQDSTPLKPDQPRWQLELKSTILSDKARFTGFNSGANALKAKRKTLQGVTTPPSKPSPKKPDVPMDALAALDRFAQRFSLSVQGLQLSVAGYDPDAQGRSRGPKIDLKLKGKASLIGGNGGIVSINPLSDAPLFSSSGGRKGGFDLAISGVDLPLIKAHIRDIDYDSSGLKAGYNLTAHFNQAPIVGGQILAVGRFKSSVEESSISLDQCLEFSAEAADFGTPVTGISAHLCQTDKALFIKGQDGWRVKGRFDALNLKASELNVGLDQAKGSVALSSGESGRGLAVEARLDSARIQDVAQTTRFNPLSVNGNLKQNSDTLVGKFNLSLNDAKAYSRHPSPIGQIVLNQDVNTHKGRLNFSTTSIEFSKGGLQPSDLSPAFKGIATRTSAGTLSLMGLIDWDAVSSSSGAVLKLNGVDFSGSLGEGKNLNTQVVFNNLSPLISLASQPVHLDAFTSVLPFTDLKTTLEFKGDRVSLGRSDGLSPGGSVRLEPMDLPLDGKADIKGVLSFNGLDFGEVIAQSELAKDVVFVGRMSGKMPFTVSQGHLRFGQSHLSADGPGHLSILPSSLTGMDGSGARLVDTQTGKGGIAEDSAMFYRQALSDLSYTQMAADVVSDDRGYLQTKLHFKGFYDPPTKKQAKIGWFDFISGKWKHKPIDLPSNTPVELFLDMPINLDQLLEDVSRYDLSRDKKAKP